MTARLSAIATLALLAACATAQENPNYQYSSKYQGLDGAPVQVASTAPVVVEAATAPVAFGAPRPGTSETEQVFDAATMEGTPGYGVFGEAEAPPAPAAGTARAVPRGSRPVDYDYSANVVIAAADTVPDTPETRSRGLGPAYAVQPGDTVYSIARSLCVPLSEVTAPNAIGADYRIRIGQTLSLPSPRC